MRAIPLPIPGILHECLRACTTDPCSLPLFVGAGGPSTRPCPVHLMWIFTRRRTICFFSRCPARICHRHIHSNMPRCSNRPAKPQMSRESRSFLHPPNLYPLPLPQCLRRHALIHCRSKLSAISVRGRERSRVLCFYGVSDVAACWNPRGMVPVR